MRHSLILLVTLLLCATTVEARIAPPGPVECRVSFADEAAKSWEPEDSEEAETVDIEEEDEEESSTGSYDPEPDCE